MTGGGSWEYVHLIWFFISLSHKMVSYLDMDMLRCFSGETAVCAREFRDGRVKQLKLWYEVCSENAARDIFATVRK